MIAGLGGVRRSAGRRAPAGELHHQPLTVTLRIDPDAPNSSSAGAAIPAAGCPRPSRRGRHRAGRSVPAHSPGGGARGAALTGARRVARRAAQARAQAARSAWPRAPRRDRGGRGPGAQPVGVSSRCWSHRARADRGDLREGTPPHRRGVAGAALPHRSRNAVGLLVNLAP